MLTWQMTHDDEREPSIRYMGAALRDNKREENEIKKMKKEKEVPRKEN